jgi:hypothetical protein
MKPYTADIRMTSTNIRMTSANIRMTSANIRMTSANIRMTSANIRMTSANNNVDREASNKWLTSADLFAETEGFLTATQDPVITTRNYKKYILTQQNNDKPCRSGKDSNTIQHITAACEQLTPTEYLKRRDGLAKIIHQKLAEVAELIEEKTPYYKYTPANDNTF